MAKEELKIGEISKPRFEFRSFGRCFCEAAKRMARLSTPVPEKVWERHSSETYIVSRTNDVNNTKIRNGKMDIKTYVQTVDGLEQWNPLMKGEFPISAQVLRDEVFPAFKVDGMPELTKDTCKITCDSDNRELEVGTKDFKAVLLDYIYALREIKVKEKMASLKHDHEHHHH